MFVNLVASVVGCLLLAFVNVASFLCCLGCEARHPSLTIPVWMLVIGGAVLPLLACVCCFYLSLSCDSPNCRRPVVRRQVTANPEVAPIPSFTQKTLFTSDRETVSAEVEARREPSLV